MNRILLLLLLIQENKKTKTHTSHYVYLDTLTPNVFILFTCYDNIPFCFLFFDILTDV